MAVQVVRIVLAVVTGIILLGSLAWVFWKKMIMPCVLPREDNDGKLMAECGPGPLLAAGERHATTRALPSTHGHGSQGSASPNSSLSSSCSPTRPSSLTNYATFSGSSSSSSGWGTPSSEMPYVYIPPIPDSAKLTMAPYKPPRNFQLGNDWMPHPRPSEYLMLVVPGEDTDDTDAAAASLHEVNTIIEAINSLPSRLINIQPNYGN